MTKHIKEGKRKATENLRYQGKQSGCCSGCVPEEVQNRGSWSGVERWRTWVHVLDTHAGLDIGLQAAPTLPLPVLPSCSLSFQGFPC